MMDQELLSVPLAGWLLPLAEVPDPVFAEGMMGRGVAIDPTGDTLHAPCDGIVTSVHGARHAVSVTTSAGAELLLHVGLDSVAMAGAGFTALVQPGDRITIGQPLIRFDLDLLIRRARSAVTPVLLVGEGWDFAALATGRLVAVGDPLLQLRRTGNAAPGATASIGAGVQRTLTVALPHGIHARPAARIAAAARGRQASVNLMCGDARSSALSMTGLLGLGAACGTQVSIEAQGADAEAVAEAIAAILLATEEADSALTAPAAPAAEVEAGTLAGVAAVPGVAIGLGHWLRAAALAPPPGSGDMDVERAGLTDGLIRLKTALDGGSGVMAAHRALLDDPDLIDAIATAVADGQGAAQAALAVTRLQAEWLAGNPDRRIAERGDDLIDIGQRLAHAILRTAPAAIRLAPGTVLLADELLPSQLAALAATPPAAIALARGGPTSHVAIMAAAQGIPMVVALGDALGDVPEGATIVVDGDAGTVRPNPDAAAQAAAQGRIARARTAAARARATGGPAVTRDGQAVGVHVNLGTAAEAAAAVAEGAEGCGLLRTELLFLDRSTPPTREEQAAEYRAIAAALAGRPLTIRLLDVGGDKPAPYLAIPREENPALGLRGIRVGLAHPDLLETQLAAILDAAHASPCRIMAPMVASVAEVEAVRVLLDRLRGDRAVQLGAMIETPAAAIGADLIASACDFLSIGSNDLTQYALAMDRGNAAVASGIDGLHPAVLRLIAATCDGAARHGVPVGVCGGLAADPLAVPILIGLGVNSLSVPPVRVAATRAAVAELSHAAAADLAQAALACRSAAAVRALARAFVEGDAA